MKLTVLACVASVTSVFAGQAMSQSAELDDVGKAIMGHEAFIQRCVDEAMERNVATAIEMGEIPTEDGKAELEAALRKLCDAAYEGVNVCMEGGASRAGEKFSQMNALVAKKLRDPLTRADDYRSYLTFKEFYDRETEALQELMAGESSHCE